VPVNEIMAGGGLTKNQLVMQIYADVMGRDIKVTTEQHASALGAAILGAISAGKEKGGYDSYAEAVVSVTSPVQQIYSPNMDNVKIYNKLYAEYKRLTFYFGHGENNVMKLLRRLRE
jgi:L-ribulokinase